METNPPIPTPPQRNRRAERDLNAAPAENPASAPVDDRPVASPGRVPRISVADDMLYLDGSLQPPALRVRADGMTAASPANTRTAAPPAEQGVPASRSIPVQRSVPVSPGSTASGQALYPTRCTSVQQPPVPRRMGQTAPPYASSSAAPNYPMPGRGQTILRDDPAARRAEAQARRASPPSPAPKAVPSPYARPTAAKDISPAVPSWMYTLLCVMLVGVAALITASLVMRAYLKTAADEKEKAYQAMLFEYHLTEQADGSLRVTWQELIEKYAAEYNLDPAFVTAIIRNESSFRTDAESRAGARGLMQMMPATAEWVAGKFDEPYDFDRLYDAETSIRYGCWYLNYLSKLFNGDPVLVCAAYHAGQGEVGGWLGDPGISPDGVTVPIENIPISNTRTYAERVTKAYGIYEQLLYPQGPAADGLSAADGSPAADSASVR